MIKKNKIQKNKGLPVRSTQTGFSLIELLVALSLFTIVAIMSVSTMLFIVDGARRSRATVDAMDSLSFALEGMTRELYVGSSYDCDGGGDCSAKDNIQFTTSEGSDMRYRLNNATNEIERCGSIGIDCTGDYISMTGSGIHIDKFDIYLDGVTFGDGEQPHITFVIEGTAGSGATASSFIIQTSVTQRFPDF